MNAKVLKLSLGVAVGAVLLTGTFLAAPSSAQTAPAAAPSVPGPSPSRSAIEARKAVFVLIGSNFRELGNILKGAKPYDVADVQKRATRLAFLSDLVVDAFPDVSNTGLPDTKARADIWTHREDFNKKVADFQAHTKALQQISLTEKSATDAFKEAVTAVGQDCKACHDDYREK